MLGQGHHGRVAARVPRRFRAAAFRPVPKPKARLGSNDEAFSNRGRSSGSQPQDTEEMKMSKFSNHGRSSGSQTGSLAFHHRSLFSNHGRSSDSQTTVRSSSGSLPFSNRGRSGGSQTSGACMSAKRTFSNRGRICRLIWAFLFQRTAKSARSSCFCDPPGRFFDRALGSPQASIPALTAVWIHYSRTIP